MKKFHFLLMFSLFFGTIVMAQNADFKNSVGLSARVQNGNLLNDQDFEFASSILNIDASFTRNINSWLNVSVPVGANLFVSDAIDNKFAGIHGDILAQIGLFDRSRIAAPYFLDHLLS